MKHIICILVACCSAMAMGQTIQVTTESDTFHTPSGAFVSLREAIRDAEAMGGFPVIEVPSFYTIELNSPLTTTTSGLSIQVRGNGGNDGSGERARIVASDSFTGSNLISVSSRPMTWRGFEIDGSVGAAPGTGIFASGGETVTVQDCVVEGWSNVGLSVHLNSGIGVKGCSVLNNQQALIANSPNSVSIESSVFYFNRLAAIRINTSAAEETEVTCQNVTLAENHSTVAALEMRGEFYGSTSVTFCTFVDNVAAGLWAPKTTTVSHCIFARNTPVVWDHPVRSVVESDTAGMNSGGYNLTDHDQDVFDQGTDTWVNAVKISRLGDFGGERYSCLPLDGSVAIDGGNPNVAALLIGADGRGFGRNNRSNFATTKTNIIDIGAVEVNPEGTLVVSNDNDSGGGSLSAVLAAATGETVHIVFHLTLLENFFSPQVPWVIDETRNYNLDATGSGLNQFTADADDGPIFEIGASASEESPTVSLSGMNFRNFAPDGSGARGCIRVLGDAKLSLHEVDFENNTPTAAGVVDLEGGGERATLFANECKFEGNEQVASDSLPNSGGAALQVEDGIAVVWNSTFVENACVAVGAVSAARRGGAVLLESGARGIFRQCTFVRNESRGDGSAIFATDYTAATDNVVLERCTLAENETRSSLSEGAVAFQNRGRILVNRTLFYRNFNNGNHSLLPVRRDLHEATIGRVTLTVEEENWTDSSVAFSGLVSEGNLSADYLLNGPGLYGGKIPVMPIVGGSEPAGNDDLGWRYPRDAKNEMGRMGVFTMPGAVQSTEGTVVEPTIDVKMIDGGPGEVTLLIAGTSGVQWDIYGGEQLNRLSDTGNDYLGTGREERLVLRVPAGDRYFLKFVEQ